MLIGDVELQNEFIMAPVKTGYSNQNGLVTDRHLDFYEKRADSLGAIIPEPFYLAKSLREIPTQMGIDSENKIAGLQKLTSTIHRGGARAIAHLNHPGRMANPRLTGNSFYSPTDKPCKNGGAQPQKMDHQDIKQAINLFKNAALRAEKADFDLLELQFGHGYLIAQFLSPAVNDRQDEYGGSFKNRSRFGLEVLQAVQKASQLPIIVRISGDDRVDGGISLSEMEKLSQILEKEGVQAIHVSAGTVCQTPPWYFQHMFISKGETWEMAAELKKQLEIPVIAVGQINEFRDVNYIKNNNMADLIALGRPLVADPDFVDKYMGRIKQRLRPCLACSDGCLGGVKSGEGLGCLINPRIGRTEYPDQATQTKSYAIVGGGLAGMSAAVFLSDRGYNVTLYEKNELGGIFRYAPLPPGKKSLQKAINYYRQEIEDREIEVVCREADDWELEEYDGAVIATGSQPFIPDIKGLEEYNWAEILLPENIPEEERIMVIGGGLIGVEIAEALADKNNEVILIELLSELGGNMVDIEKKQLVNELQKCQLVTISTETRIREIKDHRVLAEKNGEQIAWEGIERFVIATGVKPYNPYAGKEDELDVDLHIIGDAAEPAKAQDAIADAYQLALAI
ncbi:MAG: NAD(P)/FAD-dependent oxidoreductase [Bacillota bacterium]